MYTERITGIPANWLKSSLRRVNLDPNDLPLPVTGATLSTFAGRRTPLAPDLERGQGIDLIRDVPSR